jgi:hypothetical protein
MIQSCSGELWLTFIAIFYYIVTSKHFRYFSFHFRPRFWHPGLYDDSKLVLQHIDQTIPNAEIFLVGFSAGTNIVQKTVSDQTLGVRIRGIMCVCVVRDYIEARNALEDTFQGRMYSRLMTSLWKVTLCSWTECIILCTCSIYIMHMRHMYHTQFYHTVYPVAVTLGAEIVDFLESCLTERGLDTFFWQLDTECVKVILTFCSDLNSDLVSRYKIAISYFITLITIRRLLPSPGNYP